MTAASDISDEVRRTCSSSKGGTYRGAQIISDKVFVYMLHVSILIDLITLVLD